MTRASEFPRRPRPRLGGPNAGVLSALIKRPVDLGLPSRDTLRFHPFKGTWMGKVEMETEEEEGGEGQRRVWNELEQTALESYSPS